MNKDEQRIREFAYEIWVSEGKPHGEDARHWEMARKLVEAENGSAVTKPASRARKPATKPTDATPAAKPAKTKATKAAKQSGDGTAAEAAPADKPAARPKGKADTEAAEGTPAGVKKTRSTRTKKDV